MPEDLTHKGWFGICPVYFGGLHTGAPLIVERHVLLLPLMVLSEVMFSIAFKCKGLIDPDYEPEWPLRVTGELAQPIKAPGKA
jgi:hypothetical protein